MKSLKQQLYEVCLLYVENRLTSISDSIKAIQQSANEETKSTAGDKYETGRAMAQLEIDKYRTQLAEALKMKEDLLRIPVEDNSNIIKPGSLIFTSRGNFYIAVNTGQQQISSQTFFTISLGSPIAQKMNKLKVNDTFTLNNQEFTILKIQ